MKNLKFNSLFQPLKVGSVTLRNRIISSPIDTHISPEKATGGAGLIVLGDGFVSKETRSRILPNMPNPFEIENWAIGFETRKLIDTWRQGGALVSIELLHCGSCGALMGTDYVYGVCAGKRGHDGAEIIEVTEEKMKDICDEFYQSAKMAKKLGFDMITAHFAHGWLVSQFLSPYWNQRTDEYGGSYENRIKFPRMVLQAMRRGVGADFPIDMRINWNDVVGNGSSKEETARFLQDMSDEGLVDMANISAGMDLDLTDQDRRKMFMGNVKMITHAVEPHMVNIEAAKYIKEHVSIPITVVGAIHSPEEAEKIVSEGYADAVWIGRSMVADPKWAKKAYEGKSEDITPCLRCLYCYPVSTGGLDANVGCSVNPRMNREQEYPLEIIAKNKKKVVVIGGGPAGMKAAITASEMGHNVTLLEKEDTLGGIIKFTKYAPSKIDLHNYLNYLICQVEKSKIEVKVGFEATNENVSELNPDVLMIAVGSEASAPRVKGIDNSNVIFALESFEKLEELSNEVVIIGGGTIGCELSVDIAKLGKKVTVIEFTGELNSAANYLYRTSLGMKMAEYPTIQPMLNTACTEILVDGVKIKNQDGSELVVSCGNVIIATGMKSKKELVNSFYGITPETYTLGDCRKVGIIKGATEDGFFFARHILD